MKPGTLLALAAFSVVLAGCQTGGPDIMSGDNSAAVALLQRVNTGAQACWVKSKDKDFRGYSVIPELDTHGTPRILVVPSKAAQGLPKLVIEADGRPPKMSVYGPLAEGPLSGRINADVDRWAAGGASC